MEHIEGVVESITFQADDGGFTVFKVKPLQEHGVVTVVGRLAAPLLGEQLELEGDWVEHARFGRQFRLAAYKRTAPADIKGIERYLASGAVKGIGPAMAGRIVKQFGLETLTVLESAPRRLIEIEGIGVKKADMIHRSYTEQSEMREVMLFLEMHGVTGAYAGKIFAHYGSAALGVLQDDPYRLAAEVDGIGFRTADQIAMSLGVDRHHAARLDAGVDFALLQTALAGHCCVPEEMLVGEAAKLLAADRVEISLRLSELIKSDALCTEDFHGMLLIYPRHLYQAEKQVAERLLQLKNKAKPAPLEDVQQHVLDWEQTATLTLAAAQRQAMLSALAHGILALTGGPGTGKTTVVKGILDLLEAAGCKLLLGAPTGRAAKRLGETTGRQALTVHRLLESTGGTGGAPSFLKNEQQPLEADAIILDEVSMMDISLMNAFLRAVPDGCRVILVGDIDQLPAVGPGAVLKDILRSDTVPVVRLTEVFRQAEASMIVRNAHCINRGQIPDTQSSAEFQFLELAAGWDVAQAIIRLCRDTLPAEGYNAWQDIQILSPMHRQECGVENLNKLMQQALNPPQEGQKAVNSAGQALRRGDKVMQMRNNYSKGVYNGDIGFIADLEEDRIRVAFPDNEVFYERGEYEELHLAYAMSVHKSQGSEYPVVIMPLVASHHIMLQRNLLYTAVTRAKERVILLGSKAALHTAVANDRTRRRHSLLAERLRGECLC